jgi:hypothetical protein
MGDALAKAWEKIGLAAAGLRAEAMLAKEEARALIGQRADFTIGAVSLATGINSNDDGVQWRVMDTAPRDGTRILLSDKDGDLHIARWMRATSPEAGDAVLASGSGWVIWRDEAGAAAIVVDSPTHWSPLPPSPATRVEAEHLSIGQA